jgi:hypothetical protein
MFRLFIFLIVFFISPHLLAADMDSTKKNIVNKISAGLSSALENMIGGEGDTEVQIIAGEDYHPEFSIMTVRPLATHPGVDA